jgi:hypothetical protein
LSALLLEIVDTWRGAVRHTNADGFLPIHLAVSRDYVELDVANLLVEEWPESVRKRSTEGGSRGTRPREGEAAFP